MFIAEDLSSLIRANRNACAQATEQAGFGLDEIVVVGEAHKICCANPPRRRAYALAAMNLSNEKYNNSGYLRYGSFMKNLKFFYLGRGRPRSAGVILNLDG